MRCQTFSIFLLLLPIFSSSETVDSSSVSPQIYTTPASGQSQISSSNPLASLTTTAVSLGALQSHQVNHTPYNSFQPQITSFLHQFEQFANNKSVCIFYCMILTRYSKANCRKAKSIANLMLCLLSLYNCSNSHQLRSQFDSLIKDIYRQVVHHHRHRR